MKTFEKLFKRSEGQVLLEATVAISLLSFGMIGLFSLLSNAFGVNRVSTNQYIAANLAAEGLEITRNLIDTNIMAIQAGDSRAWNAGISNGLKEIDYNDTTPVAASGRFLKFDATGGFYSYDTGTNTLFKRVILINNASDYEIRVKSIIDWKDRGGLPMTVSAEDRFFAWR